ncbi:MAG: hypothetical protein AAGF44_05125 [Pseudomonadota bacterium]
MPIFTTGAASAAARLPRWFAADGADGTITATNGSYAINYLTIARNFDT